MGRSPPPRRKRPVLKDVLVVVEGRNDMRAVRAALEVDVFVLGSATQAMNPSSMRKLEASCEKYSRIVLLLDPDFAGRQARNEISRNVDNCWHAFVARPRATAREATKYKGEGDVGIEHAHPKEILYAISQSRKSSIGINRFSREELIGLGVIAPMHQRGDDVTKRRMLVCEFLGIGECDGKQLLRQLNSYGFAHEDLEQALHYANKIIQENEINKKSNSR